MTRSRKYRVQRAPYEVGPTQKVFVRVRIPAEPIVLPGALLDQGERGSNTKCAFAAGLTIMQAESLLKIKTESEWPPQVTARTMLLPTKDDPKTGFPKEGLLFEHGYTELTDRNDRGTLREYLQSHPEALSRNFTFKPPHPRNIKKHAKGDGKPRGRLSEKRGSVLSSNAAGKIALRGLRLRMKKAGKGSVFSLLSGKNASPEIDS